MRLISSVRSKKNTRPGSIISRRAYKAQPWPRSWKRYAPLNWMPWISTCRRALGVTEENPTMALNILTLLENPHDLHALRQLESGAELVDIQALLGRVNLATTQI
jgi:hypothetical protein